MTGIAFYNPSRGTSFAGAIPVLKVWLFVYFDPSFLFSKR